MAEIPERFSRQQLLAGKSKWLKNLIERRLPYLFTPALWHV